MDEAREEKQVQRMGKSAFRSGGGSKGLLDFSRSNLITENQRDVNPAVLNKEFFSLQAENLCSVK